MKGLSLRGCKAARHQFTGCWPRMASGALLWPETLQPSGFVLIWLNMCTPA